MTKPSLPPEYVRRYLLVPTYRYIIWWRRIPSNHYNNLIPYIILSIHFAPCVSFRRFYSFINSGFQSPRLSTLLNGRILLRLWIIHIASLYNSIFFYLLLSLSLSLLFRAIDRTMISELWHKTAIKLRLFNIFAVIRLLAGVVVDMKCQRRDCFTA